MRREYSGIQWGCQTSAGQHRPKGGTRVRVRLEGRIHATAAARLRRQKAKAWGQPPPPRFRSNSPHNWPIIGVTEMATKKRPRTKAETRNRGLGILFWLCLAIVLVAVAVAARAPLQQAVLRMAGGASSPASSAPAGKPAPSPKVTIMPMDSTGPGAPSASAPAERAAPAANAPAGSSPAGASPVAAVARQEGDAATTQTRRTTLEEKPSFRKSRLYFAAVDHWSTAAK